MDVLRRAYMRIFFLLCVAQRVGGAKSVGLQGAATSLGRSSLRHNSLV